LLGALEDLSELDSWTVENDGRLEETTESQDFKVRVQR